MKEPKSTARFKAVVEKCGAPEVQTLWLGPDKDPGFRLAVSENRVMTVKQEPVGAKKDFGVVGFLREPNVTYWVFPKPLDDYAEKRIIGIDYSLVKQPKFVSPTTEPGQSGAAHKPKRSVRSRFRTSAVAEPEPAEEATPAVEPPPPPPRPPPPTFRVTVRCISTVEVVEELQAEDKREAAKRALAQVEASGVDFSKGTQSRKVIRVEKGRAAGGRRGSG